MTRRVRWMEAWRQNLRANGWFPVSWVGVLGLQLRNDPNLHLAMELSLVGMVVVAATVPKLTRVWQGASRGVRVLAGVSTVGALQAMTADFWRQCLANPTALAELFGQLHEQLWLLVVAAVAAMGLGAAAVYTLMVCFWRVLWPELVALGRSLGCVERIGLAAACGLLLCTATWTHQRVAIEGLPYDAIYTTDGTLERSHPTAFVHFSHEENDLRQPLFAVCALPLTAPALCAGDLLSPLVGPCRARFVTWVQALLLVAAFAYLARCLELEGAFARVGFVAWLSAGYATHILCAQVDQYAVALFWLCFFFACREEKRSAWLLGAVAAVGSLATSAVAVGLHVVSRAGGRVWCCVRKLLVAAGAFWVAAALFCRFELGLIVREQLELYSNFSGEGLSLAERGWQFLAFVVMNFRAPTSGPACRMMKAGPFWSWQLATDIPEATRWLGAALLVVLGVGAALAWRRVRFARVCAGWVCFAWLLLGVAGWGTAENGLVLYVLYFAWAFVGLAALLLERLMRAVGAARWLGALYLVLALLTLCNTLPALADMLAFLHLYYPAR